MRALHLLWLLCASALVAAQSEVADAVRSLPGVKEVREAGQGTSAYLALTFEQPVDHANPTGPKFTQRVYLIHTGFDQPVILGTEGYSAGRPSGGELRRILGTPNVLTVEHRYFGGSIPSPLVWKHLTVKNSADDLHAVVTSFKKLYKGKWVSTGASKGGQTALFHKCFHPDDVDAVVAYVAPINVAQEDPRIQIFMEQVGTPAERQAILDFQIALLKRRAEVLPLLNVRPDDYSMGVDKAFEYGVLEFPFAYWQYGGNARENSIPKPDAPAKELADAYRAVNPMIYYGDAGIKQFEAFQYQAFTEVGYYNYDITALKPYLNHKNPTNMDLCPPGTKDTIRYDANTMAFVFHTLQYKANNIVYIYGETDPWSATAIQLLGRTNALKITVKGAWHNANVRLMSAEQKQSFFDTLESWLGIPLVRS